MAEAPNALTRSLSVPCPDSCVHRLCGHDDLDEDSKESSLAVTDGKPTSDNLSQSQYSDSIDKSQNSPTETLAVPLQINEPEIVGKGLPRSWADAPEFIPSSEASPPSTTPYHEYPYPSGSGYDPIAELCPYAMMGECQFGAQGLGCSYIHGDVCDLCNDAVLHPHCEDQRKAHMKECLARHEEDMNHSFRLAASRDKACGICYDVIMEKTGKDGERRFGILPACNHVFCLSCIRKWRQRKDDNIPFRTTRACPACREPSNFVIPSKFWVDDKEEKKELLETYKSNMRKKHCKYFKRGDASCPFGNKCFYRHELADGTHVDVGPPRRRRRRVNANSALDRFFLWDYLERQEMHGGYFMDYDLFGSSDASDDDDWHDYDDF